MLPCAEVGRELRFVDEELEPVPLGGVLRMDDLERDALREARGPELLGFVDGRHPAVRDLAQQAEGAVVLENVIFAVFHSGVNLRACNTSPGT